MLEIVIVTTILTSCAYYCSIRVHSALHPDPAVLTFVVKPGDLVGGRAPWVDDHLLVVDVACDSNHFPPSQDAFDWNEGLRPLPFLHTLVAAYNDLDSVRKPRALQSVQRRHPSGNRETGPVARRQGCVTERGSGAA